MKKIIRIILFSFILLSIVGCSKKFNVTFECDNGTDATIIEVKEGEKITKPDNPVKEGYAFKYWAIDDKEFNFEETITCDIELKAIYVKKYKITLDYDNGTENGSLEILDGEKITKPDNPTKEG